MKRPTVVFLAGLLLLAGPAVAKALPCAASATIEPDRGFVGQPLLHRTVIVRREGVRPEWIRPVQFPGFRVERPEGGSRARRLEGPEGPSVRIEQHAWLFALRAGHVRLPEARLRCGELEVAVPGPEFEALAPPAAGRPSDWTGVVGDVAITAGAEPEVTLGGTVRVHVTTRGAASLWYAAPTLRTEPPDVEIFARPTRLSLQGGETIHAVRHDVFDLVPRRTGTLRVAPLQIPHLDPASGRYRMAESEALEIEVSAPATSAVAPPDGASTMQDPTGWSTETMVGLLAAGLLLGAAWAGALAVRRRREAPDPVRVALREADAAVDPDARAAALERGLRALLARRGLDDPAMESPDRLRRFPDAATRECVEALDALVRARFDGAGRSFDADAVRERLVRELRAPRKRLVRELRAPRA
jgi:hypothetical protein